MKSYVIVAPPNSRIGDGDIGTHFPEHVTIVPGTAWAIGTHLGTCADVRDKLGANPQLGQDRPTCVIVKANEYNGYASRALWEKLALWEDS